jgi:hypothetical protein
MDWVHIGSIPQKPMTRCERVAACVDVARQHADAAKGGRRDRYRTRIEIASLLLLAARNVLHGEVLKASVDARSACDQIADIGESELAFALGL